MTTAYDTNDSIVVNDRLNILGKIRDLFGDAMSAAQLQSIVQFVLTGQTLIDPAVLELAAMAMAKEEGRPWSGASTSEEVRRIYTRRALIAISTYLDPTA